MSNTIHKTTDVKVVLCDLDGVVWLAHQPIPGSVDAIARLRGAGIRVLFVTNNSFSTVAEQEKFLGDIGIPAVGDVLTSAMSAGSQVAVGENVMVVGGAGLIEEVSRVGARVVPALDVEPHMEFDAVVVGLHHQFTYQVLADAQRAVVRGARLIGSNSDPTYPTPDGPTPGGGSILAAIATASGVSPVITGKPHLPMAQLVRHICGDVLPSEMIMVGDRPSTDGAFARTIGCRFAQVSSGVSDDTGWTGGLADDLSCANLAAVADAVVGA
jgi:4-nitrophenyl phosphatase